MKVSYSDHTILDKIFYFELALFSFFTGNNDMHLKIFSMIESPSGWLLSPAYDLLNAIVLNPDDEEELALTLAGKKKKLRREHFVQLGEGLSLTDKQIKRAFERIKNNTPQAIQWLDRSFLSDDMIHAYKEVLEERFNRLGF
jgi:serine/threonine-protein kinase HipA